MSGTTDKTSYSPGETVNVTVSGGYRPPTRARAVLYDQNGTQLAVSTGTPSVGGGPVNAPPWPVTFSSPAPTTPGTYLWRVAWYGNRSDAGSATFGAGWVADSGNANHGWEIVTIASFTVLGPAAPQINVAPASKDYGTITAGSSSGQVFTISNVGTGNLAVSAMSVNDETNFSLDTGGGTNGCGSAAPTIPAGDNCTVSVAFVPQSVSSFSATFSIASNDGANPTVNVPLTGNGVAGPVPNIGVSPASVDFGRIDVGNSSTSEVTLSNTGTANLSVSGIALSGSAAYSQDLSGGSNPCGSATPTIAPAGSCTIEVTFEPTADGGPFGATVTVSSNDPDTPNAAVSLTGTGFLDSDGDGVGDSSDAFPDDPTRTTAGGGGGGGGCGGCYVKDVSRKGDPGALLGLLALLAMLAALRRRKAKAVR
ncbi:MAG: choice-of-anchor D domain-containing protein [Candidatus Deferrimicrobiaceae bacterium]